MTSHRFHRNFGPYTNSDRHDPVIYTEMTSNRHECNRKAHRPTPNEPAVPRMIPLQTLGGPFEDK